mgnify:CR=1 FL=1
MIICDHCKGNGYVKIRFEAEQAIEQCKVCDSQGELVQSKHYYQTWSEGDADACIDQFLNFLQTHPSSTYAENASYWMADCYFKRGDFKTAVLRFDDVVARYPDGTRAPDALYRQGEALLKLGPGYGKAVNRRLWSVSSGCAGAGWRGLEVR